MPRRAVVRRVCFSATQPRKETAAILTATLREGLSPSALKSLVEQSLDADKALDVVAIPLDDQSAIADYMIIATGTSSRHVSALAEKLRDRLEARGVKPVRLEGANTSDWVVVDAGDIIVHLFRPEVRSFYNIEKMWGVTPPAIVQGQQAFA